MQKMIKEESRKPWGDDLKVTFNTNHPCRRAQIFGVYANVILALNYEECAGRTLFRCVFSGNYIDRFKNVFEYIKAGALMIF